jgi:putative thioredoxin
MWRGRPEFEEAMPDVTDATFNTAVVERSKTVPVVVDLWAPWCGPCKTLGPIIEKVIADTNGAVELAKVNVDENPATAQAFQVQGIPAVFAIVDGRVVDSFVGAQGEAAVRTFVEALVSAGEPSQVDLLVAAGDRESLQAALELEPDHEGAIVALAELLAAEGEDQQALDLLARIPETGETRRVAAMIRTGAPDQDDVLAKLDELLERVRDDETVRQQFVDLLDVLGPEHPRTAEYRRRLSSALF